MRHPPSFSSTDSNEDAFFVSVLAQDANFKFLSTVLIGSRCMWAVQAGCIIHPVLREGCWKQLFDTYCKSTLGHSFRLQVPAAPLTQVSVFGTTRFTFHTWQTYPRHVVGLLPRSDLRKLRQPCREDFGATVEA
mmetsp:Transcript_6161/g.18620  ORF Transcript_6161/g.18620 Transcript_6161/m.18620 type:complete len:134 (+) Transcript_6161:189-590(+)